jgi:hypothetical protein
MLANSMEPIWTDGCAASVTGGTAAARDAREAVDTACFASGRVRAIRVRVQRNRLWRWSIARHGWVAAAVRLSRGEDSENKLLRRSVEIGLERRGRLRCGEGGSEGGMGWTSGNEPDRGRACDAK